MLTQKRLKELLCYDPGTGVFTNLISRSPSAVAGAVAGWIDIHNGYIQIQIDGRNYPSHRLAWLYVYGEFPIHEIDHTNGKRDDNRIVNLRAVTSSENSKNSKIRSTNTSGITGVSWCKNSNKWMVQISDNKKQINLGRFSDKFEAICARKSAENRLGYHPNHGLTEAKRGETI